MKKFGILLYIVLFLLNCGPKQDKVERKVENGVEIVINHLEPYKIGSQNSLTLEEILTIDTEDDKIANLGIPDIFGFSVNSLGEIYILRAYKGEGDFIFKFNSIGEYEKPFGPQGQGPGELQNPHYIAIDHNDNIMISDINQQILRKYNKDGVFIGDFKIESGDIPVTLGPRANLLVKGDSYKSDKGRALNTYSLKLLNPDLEVLQVIDEFSFERRQDKAKATEPIVCWSVSHDNIYVVNENREYEIWVYDFKGKLIRKIQKQYKQIPISENFKKKTLKQFPESMRDQMKDMLYFPKFHPPIQNLVAGDDGLLLVSTFEEGENPEEFMFDIFNEEGVFIGRKSLNIWIWEGYIWARIKAGKFYVLREKESGYKELAVYNMIWK